MNNQSKQVLITACILGALGVVLGAFAAHGLQNILTKTQIESFQTGVRYQFYHTFLLLFVGGSTFLSSRQKKIIWLLILIGITCFSGSIYILNLDEYIFDFNLKALAFITPVGGLVLISAWVYLLISLRKVY